MNLEKIIWTFSFFDILFSAHEFYTRTFYRITYFDLFHFLYLNFFLFLLYTQKENRITYSLHDTNGLHLPTYLMLMHKLSVRICQWMIELAQRLPPLYIEETHRMEGHAMQGLIQSHLNFYCYSSFGSPDFISFGGTEMKSPSRFHLPESKFHGWQALGLWDEILTSTKMSKNITLNLWCSHIQKWFALNWTIEVHINEKQKEELQHRTLWKVQS